MRKITVRVEEDDGDAFAAFCASNGVSMQSTLASMLIAAVEVWERFDRQPVANWPPEYLTQRGWEELINRARLLDSEKRRRS